MGQKPADPFQELLFDPIKEHRGPYFVSYRPPDSGNDFATLSLVFLSAAEIGAVADFMKVELHRWLDRYPVPLMVFAFDATDRMLVVENGHNQLVGWVDPSTGLIAESWEIDDLTAFLQTSPAQRLWRSIYLDVPFRTRADVRIKADKEARELAQGAALLRFAVIFWAAILPATIAAVGYFGPEWLSLVGLVLSWWKAWRTWLKLTGRIKPSDSEKEKSEKELMMAHYFYHCERNPEGFARLRAENTDRETRERTRKEAADLAQANSRG